MITVSKTIITETGHRLLDYDGRCAHLHGHSWKWKISVKCPDNKLNTSGMVMDFKDLKGFIKAVLDDFDHAMILRRDDPLIVFLAEDWRHALKGSNGEEGRVILVDFNPTSENLCGHIKERLEDLFKMSTDFSNVEVESVKCWETNSSSCLVN